MDYQLIDADNHYYESEDCFTRHGDEAVQKLRALGVGGRSAGISSSATCGQTMVPNPTFNPITSPARSTSGSRTSPRAASAGTRRQKDLYGTASWNRCPRTIRTATHACG